MVRDHSPRPRSRPLRALRAIAGGAVSILLVLFALWLLKMLYFDRSWEEEMLSRYRDRDQAGQGVAQRAAPQQRFHLDIPHSLDTLLDPPVCFTCHTAYPHRRDVRARAYLNMHGAFLACEVCHFRPAQDTPVEFVWFTDKGDRPVRQVNGSRGVYGAHIYPARRDNQGHLQRLGKRVNEPEWARLAQELERLTPGERLALQTPADAQRFQRVHTGVLDPPLDCAECHRVGGLLDFAELGYDPPMVHRLEHLEVVEMLTGTTQFYFPDLRGTLTPIEASP